MTDKPLTCIVIKEYQTEPWWVPGKGHNDILQGNEREYLKRLTVFIHSIQGILDKNRASTETSNATSEPRYKCDMNDNHEDRGVVAPNSSSSSTPNKESKHTELRKVSQDTRVVSSDKPSEDKNSKNEESSLWKYHTKWCF